MCARNRHGLFVVTGQNAEQLGALQHRNPACIRCGQLGVIAADGGRIDHELGIPEIFRAMTGIDRNAERLDALAVVRFSAVGAGDLISLRMKNFGKRAHTAAADSHKMDAVNLFQNRIRDRHVFHPFPENISGTCKHKALR